MYKSVKGNTKQCKLKAEESVTFKVHKGHIGLCQIQLPPGFLSGRSLPTFCLLWSGIVGSDIL